MIKDYHYPRLRWAGGILLAGIVVLGLIGQYPLPDLVVQPGLKDGIGIRSNNHASNTVNASPAPTAPLPKTAHVKSRIVNVPDALQSLPPEAQTAIVTTSKVVIDVAATLGLTAITAVNRGWTGLLWLGHHTPGAIQTAWSQVANSPPIAMLLDASHWVADWFEQSTAALRGKKQ